MLPIILSCSDSAKADNFIDDFVRQNAVINRDITRIRRLEKKKEISIDQIRSIHALFTHTYTQLRVIVIEDYHTASEEAQNALLKILEEKTGNVQFFLVVNNQYKVLPTIRSRSKIQFIDSAQIQPDESLLKAFLNGEVAALGSQKVSFISSENAALLCDTLLVTLRKTGYSFKSASLFAKEVLRIKQLLLENNLNPQLAVDYLILSRPSS